MYKKTCTKCKVEKSTEDFSYRTDSGRRRRRCKVCIAAQKAAHYENNKDQWAMSKQDQRNKHRYYRYGITPEVFEEMLAKQNHSCALCKIPVSDSRELHVDHDHRCCPPTARRKYCGKCTRALLCRKCNLGVGYLNEDPELFRAAIDYLASYKTS